MKRTQRWLSVLLTLLLLSSLSVSALAEKLYYETTGDVNLRKGAGTDKAIVTTVKKGQVVEVLQQWYADWWNVKYTTADARVFEGYMNSSYLKKTNKKSNKEEKKNTAPLGCYYATTALSLRKGPGASYAARTTVPGNALVEVIDTTDELWYQVNYISKSGTKYKKGYLSSKYLKKAAEPYKVKKKTELRKSPSSSSKSLAPLPKNTHLFVTSYYSKKWYKVSFTDYYGKTHTGYVLKSKISKSAITNVPYKQPDPEAEAKQLAKDWLEKPRYQVKSKSKLTESASKKGKKLADVPKNSVVAVTGSKGKFYKVIYNNAKNKKQRGYLPKSALQKYKDPNAGQYVTKVETELRAQDSQTSKVVVELPQYVLLSVNDSSEKSWLRVSYKDEDGKTHKGFVYKSHAKKYVETKAGNYFTLVETALREKPGDTAPVSTELPRGTTIKVRKTYNPKWYYVTYIDENGEAVRGFVKAEHLKKRRNLKLSYVAKVQTTMRTLPNNTAEVETNVAEKQSIRVLDNALSDWFWCTFVDTSGVRYSGYIQAAHLMTRADYNAQKQDSIQTAEAEQIAEEPEQVEEPDEAEEAEEPNEAAEEAVKEQAEEPAEEETEEAAEESAEEETEEPAEEQVEESAEEQVEDESAPEEAA